MEITAILVPAAILGGIGVLLGGAIAVANRVFWVWSDPRIDGTEELLPGTNCGACGEPGCRAFAEALVAGRQTPAECTNMSAEEREDVAAYLGTDVGEAEKRVARLLCAGGSDVAPREADYRGAVSCAAAVAVTGGGKACSWGCVGLGDCAVACDYDAIRMSDVQLPVVDPELCTACEDCVAACPLDLFVVWPVSRQLIVQCRSLLQGDAATSLCAAACDACGRCAVDAAPGLIEMKNGLPVIDYARNELATPEATLRCPTGAIQWVVGAQFQEREAAAGAALLR
ncbi:MAG TPA: (Fe-S)-binding protein [Gemmatimonadota bacterium]|nr:(Fe-S)-binding protein [Gemmatimonadota bacterium]